MSSKLDLIFKTHTLEPTGKVDTESAKQAIKDLMMSLLDGKNDTKGKNVYELAEMKGWNDAVIEYLTKVKEL